ncbi:MAG TPA: Fe-S cluster assembly protein SufD [bacterium]
MAEVNISLDGIREFSKKRHEPDWLTEARFEAFRQSELLPLPETRHTRIKGLSLASLNPLAGANGKGSPAVRNGAAHFIQVNSEIVRANLPGEFAEKGVIVSDMNKAFSKHPEIFHKYFLQPGGQGDKFETMLKGFFAGGLLIYVPANVRLTEPLLSSFTVSGGSAAMFVPVVIIAEDRSEIKIIDNYASEGEMNAPSLLVSAVSVFVKESARVDYISIRNLGNNVFSFSTLRSNLMKDSTIDCRFGWFGGRLSTGRICNSLDGEGATSSETQVFFLTGKEHLHITSDLMHRQRNTTAKVLVRGAMRDSARSVFYGNVLIDKDAQNADSLLSDHILLLTPGARGDSIPGLEIKANQVRASHSASIGQIDEEQVFYLMSRGMPEAEARKTIVSGFLSPAIEAIPHESFKNSAWEIFEKKWEAA